TQIVVDGLVDDWSAYPAALLLRTDDGTVYGLRNQESIYLALQLDADALPESYNRLAVVYTLEGATYRALIDPRLPEEAATWRRVNPIEADLGTLAVAKTQADAIELRVPLAPLRSILGAVLD